MGSRLRDIQFIFVGLFMHGGSAFEVAVPFPMTRGQRFHEVSGTETFSLQPCIRFASSLFANIDILRWRKGLSGTGN